ncbi:UDP-3-O-acyl-N-acetylglucosamine deacetylase [Acetobacteraceae bacterium ESL0709]|nr:UDP-3-O-acyl-N-acetylglucosamine deacetylase [Acetobacteraceae bacterium ESL0697]MDF7678391.1 UDP-3-O-acyl-N-acetylglucosamine deacetylase [Acetobacteraceae bacterium ESL0709]
MGQKIEKTTPGLSLPAGKTAIPACPQTTIRNPIFCRGTGLHSGRDITLKLVPQPANSGILFQRVDISHTPPFRLTPESLKGARLSTIIADPDRPEIQIATIEHLMASLHALAIDNILIQLDGPETPIFDGSAQDFAFLLSCAGQKELPAPRRFIKILHPLIIRGENGAFVSLSASKKREFSLKMAIEFSETVIGSQKIAFVLKREDFLKNIASSRTFVSRDEIETLHKQGLALGGSLENALVVEGDHVLNPEGLRSADEFVRHKLLDAIGDSYCMGYQIIGKFDGFKSGHELNNRLIKALAMHKETWQFIS